MKVVVIVVVVTSHTMEVLRFKECVAKISLGQYDGSVKIWTRIRACS